MRIAGTTKGKIRWEQWSRALSNYRLWNRSTRPSPIASNTGTNSGGTDGTITSTGFVLARR